MDPNTRAAAFVVAEVDVTQAVRGQQKVSQLQSDLQALLQEILPQQVRAGCPQAPGTAC